MKFLVPIGNLLGYINPDDYYCGVRDWEMFVDEINSALVEYQVSFVHIDAEDFVCFEKEEEEECEL